MSWFNFRKKSQDSKINGEEQENNDEGQEVKELNKDPKSGDLNFDIEETKAQIECSKKYSIRRKEEMKEEQKQFEATQQKLNNIFDRTEEKIAKLTSIFSKLGIDIVGKTKPYYTINYNSQTKDDGPDEFKGIPRQIDEPEVKSLNS